MIGPLTATVPAGSLVNAGTILATGTFGSDGVHLFGVGPAISNSAGGYIRASGGFAKGVYIDGVATVVNDGTISGTGSGGYSGTGVWVHPSPSFISGGLGLVVLTNNAAGVIEGSSYGVMLRVEYDDEQRHDLRRWGGN